MMIELTPHFDARTSAARFARGEPVGLDFRRTIDGVARPLAGEVFAMVIWRGDARAKAVATIESDVEGDVARVRFAADEIAKVADLIGLQWAFGEAVLTGAEIAVQPIVGGSFAWIDAGDFGDVPAPVATGDFDEIVLEEDA